MTNDYRKSVDGEHRYEENIYIPKTEKDKSPPTVEYNGQNINPAEAAIMLLLSQSAQQTLATLSGDLPPPIQIDLKKLKVDIRALHGSFETLSKSNESHNTLFLTQLSKQWNALSRHFISHPISFKPSPWETKMKTFILAIKSYPFGVDHTFGYYLEHYAGEEWIPFPYMEMLETLHHNKGPASPLGRWMTELVDILNMIDF